MGNSDLFTRNILALSERNPALASRLSKTEAARNAYEFRESRSGKTVPAMRDASGEVHPLHSMFDPEKEARRLISTVESEGFLILLGLGGGYYAEAALERDDISEVLVIEYDLSGIAELFCRIDYTRLFDDSRFRLFAGAPHGELTAAVTELYRPVLSGGIRVIPLRPRTALEPENFAAATGAIETAVKRVSADYSVQAHFGKRWLSNIVRNLKPAGAVRNPLPEIRRAAITAAGPSLTAQIPRLRETRDSAFLIATDTSLPCLLREKITPDAVISIDCQHISYYHFMDGLPEDVPLFLDLASPPPLARLSTKPYFFSGGHPLTRYISKAWKAMPEIDTSGGNVTYAALSLAETLGADYIELYGADFSYPAGLSYAKGAYIHSFFDKRQNRFSPMEAQASAFLFRTPLEKKNSNNGSWYYETETMKFYREKLEEKSETMRALLVPVRGFGAPLNVRQGENRPQNANRFLYGEAALDAGEFLKSYRAEIAKLPKAEKNAADFLASLDDRARTVFTTILPAAAAVKQRRPAIGFEELMEETKAYCVKEIDAVLASMF